MGLSQGPLTVQGGRFKGEEFFVEADILEMPGWDKHKDHPKFLELIAMEGNMAAFNAVMTDGYKSETDAPFYYGKIGSLGYVISHKDLYGTAKI